MTLAPNAVLTCVWGGAVVAKGKNRDAQISQVGNYVRRIHIVFQFTFENSVSWNTYRFECINSRSSGL